MNFQECQKYNTLKAAKILMDFGPKAEIETLSGKLLMAIGNHPSLMESTYEYNEDIQNAVNNLCDLIIKDFGQYRVFLEPITK